MFFRLLLFLLPIEKMTPFCVLPGRRDNANVQSAFNALRNVVAFTCDHPLPIGWAAVFAPSGPSTASSVMSDLSDVLIDVSDMGSTVTASLPWKTLWPDVKS